MKFNQLAVSALCATVVLAAPAFAQQPQQQVRQPVQVMDADGVAKAVTIDATVAAIDPSNRVVTLKNSDGREFAVHADKRVNLGNIKVGDSVSSTYIRAEALDFQKGDGIRMEASTVAAQPAARGVPGGAALKRNTVVSNVWAIDAAQGNVTVLGPYGHLTQVHLKDPALLSGVKVGDQMKVVYTEAVATALVKKS